jgi:uncharacterized protein
MLASKRMIHVEPLSSYLQSAVNSLIGSNEIVYDPGIHEWALIIDTNGDVYNHGEAYLPEGLCGNIFRDELDVIMSPSRRSRSVAVRKARANTCDKCQYGSNCSRVPLIEAVPSERAFNDRGHLICPIAKPMIEYMVEVLSRFPEVQRVISASKVGGSTLC